MRKHAVLCVDDEIDNVDSLERLLRKNYRVLKATSGQDALLLLQNQPGISVIITDQRMPQMTGVEFLQQSLLIQPKAMRILLTGYTDLESVISAINLGQIHRYLTKPWDPTDLLHTVEQAIQRYEMSLELERTNDHLQKALRELEELDRTKTEFMILINHELKTPLTSILNFTGLALESSPSDEMKLYLTKIEANAQRLRNVVEDCLLVIKTLNRQIQAQEQDFVLKEILSLLDETSAKRLHDKNLKLEKDFQEVTLKTDPVWFREIMKRVLNNAVKFSPPGKTILLKLSHGPQGREVLTIENEGPQIQNLDKVFKPFFLDENMMNHSQGLGLGLAISKGLADILHCNLHIENTPQGVRTQLIFR